MLNTAYESDRRPPSPDATRVASHADIGLFFGCADVEAAFAHLAVNGIKADPPKVAPYGMQELYVTNPGRLRPGGFNGRRAERPRRNGRN